MLLILLISLGDILRLDNLINIIFFLRLVPIQIF